jgi:hypothetical protein
MKRHLGNLALVTLLVLPGLVSARSHGLRHAFKHHPGLAKTAAAAAVQKAEAAVTKDNLTGFWSSAVSDSSDPEFLYYDTVQIIFAGDGTMETREATRNVGLDTAYTSYEQIFGTWKIEDTSLIITMGKCTDYDDEGVSDCTDEATDTLPTSAWDVTSGSPKTLVMDSDYPDEFFTYVGASAAFTVAAPDPSALRPFEQRLAERRRAVIVNMAPAVTSGLRVMDIRGRAVPAGVRGIFILR